MVAGMDQDHEAKADRLEEQARTRDAGSSVKRRRKPKPHEIDPERLRKAVRYLREHPERRASASDF
jgi:hypothetical protein